MKNLKLFPPDGKPTPNKRRGPPNRMNDLSYSDWMKFQKSFFRHSSSRHLPEECVRFFTKAVWPDGRPSRSLLIGFEGLDDSLLEPPRIIKTYPASKLADVAHVLSTQKRRYDFILVDLRHVITDTDRLTDYLQDYARSMMTSLRRLLFSKRYCGILVGLPGPGGGGFPTPWAVAQTCRNHLRLRDEKVGLVEQERTIYYCLFMQANDDERPPEHLSPERIHLADAPADIPPWIIPKPPPRSRQVKLHPAKYPETLISDFIELFSDVGDNILDPMVGTGSSIIAAIRTGRNAYGVDLVADFVAISNDRIRRECAPTLFDEFNYSGTARAVLGDATQLDSLAALDGVSFQYAVTSPPYWSMLSNPGSEGQEQRRSENLPLVYSHDQQDLGNVQDYDRFLDLLVRVYDQVAKKLVHQGVLTVVVKNVKRNHILYTLAWDLVLRLAGPHGSYDYLGTTLWCQDDVGLKPFAVGIHWVSNTLHHYCLHFQKR